MWIDFAEEEGWPLKDHEARVEVIAALQEHVPVKVLVNSELAVAILDSMLTAAQIDRSRSPIQDHDFEVFQESLQQIRSAPNIDGKPFQIVEIPVPDISLYQEEFVLDGSFPEFFSAHSAGDTVRFVPVMSYANFLVTDDVVLVPEYWREGLPEEERRKDGRMKQILARYFPDRKIVGIRNAILLNWNGGGIHCQTQQEPMIGAPVAP